MDILHITRPAPLVGLDGIPMPSDDAPRAQALVDRCPVAGETPLSASIAIATQAAVQDVWIKDERGRMGLGSFKALGAAYVIASDAQEGDVSGRTYVTASAGNHGMSVAAGAKAFGAASVVYIAETVPESFAARLEEQGAQVVRQGETYEDSLRAAEAAAEANGWDLLSDGSWHGYTDRPHRLMEGYTVLMAEAIRQIPQQPTHIFLQAGVGGLACACAALARQAWGDGPRIIVVEPDAAPALQGSIVAGKAVESSGPVSEMGRLDCKMPSLIALKGLARDADDFALISEEEGQAGAGLAMVAGFGSSPSGAAGISALIALDEAQREQLGITIQSRILCVLSEGPA
ncbi:pyridoxal-phosphate dependent enzyme [Sulfitobacter donghicola]|uniref:Diaminopropionate ammonia-lyase n=1 Tax=Sulfitobacter donghicola DSW-25 = KCTC 12864 = JCM 14565 TaxID=1300350 RepID=A0A073IJA4_9RHOB|nr:pyridoxal-phosphate dependent enzyme [Sulfitobacter donghicola]KEJ89854.1 diaminopropionate ammonia-lyase [Sulfitobacter donghicola DSW-25 = KCTC 12864 = JCM 14565]KIN67025.1 Pyridoxal-5'-phosphate-dependent enzyme, beta subunit [Sulfitobacter donghicola DSW-25 = KCTC 12864 = JCM 14565]